MEIKTEIRSEETRVGVESRSDHRQGVERKEARSIEDIGARDTVALQTLISWHSLYTNERSTT